MDKTRISYLIQQSRNGHATPEEMKELESFWEWAQQDDSLFNSLSDSEKASIKQVMFEGIQERIAALETVANGKQRTMPVSGLFLKIAASFTLLILITTLWLKFNNPGESYRTAYGEHMEIVLPDSSRVTMNGNSTLRYSEWDEDDDRHVWVEGEAFFDVTHTVNDQKFIVHTEDGVDVEVLGTRFNVKIRRGKTEVMLEEGKVNLNVKSIFASKDIVMKPGDMIQVENSALNTVQVDASRYTAWKDHKLYFDETRLEELAHILEDTYGISVEFANPGLADRRLSGEIDSRKASDILAAIKETFNITVSRDGNKVRFHSKK
jgi:ferric-dicitrate binding protein FerR (iron transport regulator)